MGAGDHLDQRSAHGRAGASVDGRAGRRTPGDHGGGRRRSRARRWLDPARGSGHVADPGPVAARRPVPDPAASGSAGDGCGPRSGADQRQRADHARALVVERGRDAGQRDLSGPAIQRRRDSGTGRGIDHGGNRDEQGIGRPSDAATARSARTAGRGGDRAGPGGQAVPGVLRLAAAEPRHHGPSHDGRPRRRRGHPTLEHEPAADLAGQQPGGRGVPARCLHRTHRAAPGRQLRLAAAADPHRGGSQPGQRRQSPRRPRTRPRGAAGRRRAAGSGTGPRSCAPT